MIKVELNNNIAYVEFEDKAHGNQLKFSTIKEFYDTFYKLRHKSIKFIILSSSNKGHWLEHAHLKDIHNLSKNKKTSAHGKYWFKLIKEIRNEDVVYIAAINGNASGGGAELGWFFDFRISQKNVYFSQPEVDFGICPGLGGISMLSCLIGPSIANQLVMSGDKYSSTQLHNLGLINILSKKGQIKKDSLELANFLSLKSNTALSSIKKIFNNYYSKNNHLLEYEQKTFLESINNLKTLET